MGYLRGMACPVCNKPLSEERTKRRATYCSNECSRKSEHQKYTARNGDRPRLPSGTTGAISELIVAADLLRRGYEVFRALSPSCSCDLAVLRNGQLLRVEVRSASLSVGGKWMYSRDRLNFPGTGGPVRADVLAVRLYSGPIEYYPPLPDVTSQQTT